MKSLWMVGYAELTGHILMNAVTVQVKSWYVKFPVIRLYVYWRAYPASQARTPE